jgi:hypothetical protein
MLAKLNVKCRGAGPGHMLTLFQDGARHPAQLLPLPVPSTTSTTPRERTAKPAAPPATGDVPSTGCTRDIQCHHCNGFGHVIRDCPSKRTLLIRDNGEYSSASDSEETRHAMLATDHVDNEEVHVTPGDADRYESLVA